MREEERLVQNGIMLEAVVSFKQVIAEKQSLLLARSVLAEMLFSSRQSKD
jgi:hypothetical protein